jgi:hypothetical protein
MSEVADDNTDDIPGLGECTEDEEVVDRFDEDLRPLVDCSGDEQDDEEHEGGPRAVSTGAGE